MKAQHPSTSPSPTSSTALRPALRERKHSTSATKTGLRETRQNTPVGERAVVRNPSRQLRTPTRRRVSTKCRYSTSPPEQAYLREASLSLYLRRRLQAPHLITWVPTAAPSTHTSPWWRSV